MAKRFQILKGWHKKGGVRISKISSGIKMGGIRFLKFRVAKIFCKDVKCCA